MPDYNKSIFINCPFDREYYPLLRPLIYTILHQGFIPRIASENSDSGKPRLEKLKELISESKYSIHDLSRIQSKTQNEYYRLNMSFELGIDFGCRLYSGKDHNEKRFLILGKESYRHMKALSDINGLDIKSHQNEPIEVVIAVRNWFVETIEQKEVKSGTAIWYDFNDFQAFLYDEKKSNGFSDREIEFMPIPELTQNMQKWISR